MAHTIVRPSVDLPWRPASRVGAGDRTGRTGRRRAGDGASLLGANERWTARPWHWGRCRFRVERRGGRLGLRSLPVEPQLDRAARGWGFENRCCCHDLPPRDSAGSLCDTVGRSATTNSPNRLLAVSQGGGHVRSRWESKNIFAPGQRAPPRPLLASWAMSARSHPFLPRRCRNARRCQTGWDRRSTARWKAVLRDRSHRGTRRQQ